MSHFLSLGGLIFFSFKGGGGGGGNDHKKKEDIWGEAPMRRETPRGNGLGGEESKEIEDSHN